MADIRIKDLATTASSTAADDFLAVDGTTNGTRKLSAATPSFATSVTVPGVAGPTATDLTLAGGSTGASLVLGQGANANATITPTGTGGVTLQSSANNGDVLLKLRGTNASPNGTIRWTTSTDTYTVGIGSRFNVGDSGLEFLIGSSTTGMNLRSTGNLLIGTTTDGGQKLQVAGDLRVNHTGSAVIDINSTAAAGSATRFLNSGTVFGYLGSGKYVISNSYDIASIALATSGAQSLYLGTNGTTALTLASNQAATFAGTVTAADSGFILTSGGSMLHSSNSVYLSAPTSLVFRTNAATPTPRLTLTDTTATFAGAVAINNTVAAAAGVASTHKVTMVIGGVTYYLLASNV